MNKNKKPTKKIILKKNSPFQINSKSEIFQNKIQNSIKSKR